MDEFSLTLQEDKEWKVIHRTPMIYYKTKFNERFKFEVPYSENALLYWYKEQLESSSGSKVGLIQGISSFLNGQRLSLQVPMHKTLYTDSIEMTNLNDTLKHCTVKYTEEFYDIDVLQRVIKGEYKEC